MCRFDSDGEGRRLGGIKRDGAAKDDFRDIDAGVRGDCDIVAT